MLYAQQCTRRMHTSLNDWNDSRCLDWWCDWTHRPSYYILLTHSLQLDISIRMHWCDIIDVYKCSSREISLSSFCVVRFHDSRAMYFERIVHLPGIEYFMKIVDCLRCLLGAFCIVSIHTIEIECNAFFDGIQISE